MIGWDRGVLVVQFLVPFTHPLLIPTAHIVEHLLDKARSLESAGAGCDVGKAARVCPNPGVQFIIGTWQVVGVHPRRVIDKVQLCAGPGTFIALYGKKSKATAGLSQSTSTLLGMFSAQGP